MTDINVTELRPKVVMDRMAAERQRCGRANRRKHRVTLITVRLPSLAQVPVNGTTVFLCWQTRF
jgi:hypothetical protein